MHKERALRHFKDVLDMCDDDALKEWEKYDTNTKEKDRDMQGPSQSRLRLPIPIEDYIMGENRTEHAKELRMESAKKKLKNADDLIPMQERLEIGHAAMTDDMHRLTGASVLSGIAKAGSSSFLDASGAGAFGSSVAGSEGGAAFGSDMNLTCDDDGPAKKKKRYEIEFNREKVANMCKDTVDDVKNFTQEMLNKASSAEEIAKDCENVIEGMGRWRQILRTRSKQICLLKLSPDVQMDAH